MGISYPPFDMRPSMNCEVTPSPLATEIYDGRITLQDLELMKRLLPLVKFIQNELRMLDTCFDLSITTVLIDLQASSVSSPSDFETLDDPRSGGIDDVPSKTHRQENDQDNDDDEDDEDDADDDDHDDDDDTKNNGDDDDGNDGKSLLKDHVSWDEQSGSSTRHQSISSERLHVAAEKRYSSSVRGKIRTLHNMISSRENHPEGVASHATRPIEVPEKLSKAAILGKAVEHIEMLVSTYEYYESRHDRLLRISKRCLAALEQHE